MREALQLAEAMSPCSVWCDEVDKSLSGAQGSGTNDSGTTMRVFGTLLTWMQEKKQSVMLVMTANRVEHLPPEFLRRGRFDEIFSIDLPHVVEREQITSVILKRFKRDPKKFDLVKIAEATNDCTGAEIEAVVSEALFHAFDAGREIETDDILAAAKNLIPLAKTAAEKIEAIRKWGEGRARQASKPPQVKEQQSGRKLKV
jgi:SpoVK/Ycf46/Vps4 family AAA+-type ATPase